MTQSLVIIADPGIDGAFAIALAMLDPDLDVLALAATAGNVSAEQATRNVHILVEQIDPTRLPRIGAAPAVEYDVDRTWLHGPTGLGATSLLSAEKHHTLPSDKLLSDLVRQNPREVTVVVMGPATVLASAIDREPDLPALVRRIICMGGTWREPGNASAAAEFHFYCDPLAARQVLRCGAPLTLVPLDASRKLLFSPSDLLELPSPDSPPCRLLRQVVPFGIGAMANALGIEGFHLEDVLGLAAVTVPGALTTRPMVVDVETRGELTRGMSVFDLRRDQQKSPNVELVVDVDLNAVKDYIQRVLSQT